MKEVSINDIINKLNEINIIDIRDNYRYRMGFIPNSINIPMNFLLMNPKNYLEFEKEYYIYCEMGNNSRTVCNELNKKGYNVFNINGGYNSYRLYDHLTK